MIYTKHIKVALHMRCQRKRSIHDNWKARYTRLLA